MDLVLPGVLYIEALTVPRVYFTGNNKFCGLLRFIVGGDGNNGYTRTLKKLSKKIYK